MKEGRGENPDLPVKGEKEKGEKQLTATAVAVATAITARRQKGRERAVFIQAVKERQKNRKTATAEKVRAEKSVFRAEYK